MSIKNTLRPLFAAALVCLLAACGGGGGDSSDSNSTSAQYTPAALQATIAQRATDSSYSFNETIALGNLPQGPVYLLLQPDQPILGVTIGFTANANGTYTISLPIMANIPVGSYDGVIHVTLCKDMACASAWPNTVPPLPYHIVIKPGIQTSILINGVPYTMPSGSSAIPDNSTVFVPRGAQVTVTASQNVAWGTSLPMSNTTNTTSTLQFPANTADTEILNLFGTDPTVLSNYTIMFIAQ